MELYEVMRTTSAVRQFTADEIPDDVLRRILDNARFAPSGGNRQGAHIVVVRERATREALAELTATGARRYFAQVLNGEAPWNPLQPCGVSPQDVAATEVPDMFTEPLLTASVVLVISIDLAVVAATDQDLDRVGVVSGASVYPLVWNILLAARSEGYGGTLTTMAVPEESRVRDLLGIPQTHAVAAVVPLGTPRKQPTRLTRRPVGDFVSRERFDGAPY